ncbi:flagellar motor protein MotB [Thermotoga sp. SG1]|uniref:OmpA/MotB family protein n=1 Tax=Thermotoga sp. SG1 TaxID=126739 RepID=UPI000CCAB8DA|nr:flagellar motor protein MotB [Thermotoga sp. SG1]PLV57037.1 flagellar motor protein MotB [Thermotoga sp. SG1]
MAKKKEEQKGSPQWMTTYSDMVTLLLTFFVALISMSTISPGKFQQVAVGLRIALSGQPPSVLMGGRSINEEPLITSKRGIYQELMRLSEEYKGKITVEERDEGTLIVLKDMVFFETGSARLTAEAKELLAKVGQIVIEHTTNVLEIFGYTDDRPVLPNSIYVSNWHLSSARAASVVNFFLTELKEKRMIERAADIKLGRFNIDFFYNPDRFYPIGLGDREIKKKMRDLENEINAEKALLNERLRNGEITRSEWEAKMKELEERYQQELERLRREFRRIDILIKRERV